MAGESWWKDSMGAEHLMLIEGRPRPKHKLKWGVSKKDFLTVENNLTEKFEKPKGTA